MIKSEIREEFELHGLETSTYYTLPLVSKFSFLVPRPRLFEILYIPTSDGLLQLQITSARVSIHPFIYIYILYHHHHHTTTLGGQFRVQFCNLNQIQFYPSRCIYTYIYIFIYTIYRIYSIFYFITTSGVVSIYQ